MYKDASRRRAAPQVQPVIAEILRTCVYPKILHLRLERVVRQGRAIKLFLSDGQLLIQALLLRTLSTLPEIEDLAVGDILEIRKFAVRKAKRTSGDGHVIYLGIENCYVIKKEEAMQDGTVSISSERVDKIISPPNNEELDGELDDTAGGFIRSSSPEGVEAATKGNKAQPGLSDMVQIPCVPQTTILGAQVGELGLDIDSPDLQVLRNEELPHEPISAYRPHQKRKYVYISDSESENEAFETVHFNPNTANKRRKALHELSQNMMSSPLRPAMNNFTQVKSESNQSEIESHMKRTSTVKFELDGNSDDEEPEKSGVHTDRNLDVAKRPPNFDHHQERNWRVSVNEFHISSKILRPPVPSTSSRPTTPIHNASQLDQFGPFHDLLSLYSSTLPPKSYVFTTLVVTTYVSSHLIARPNSPFPPKRHIKVIDQSVASKFINNKTNILGKGVTVSVYRDASDFKPKIGRVALMRGVVMQRIGGAMRNGSGTGQAEVILNVYPIKSRIQRQSQISGQRQQPHTQQYVSQNQHNRSPTQTRNVNLALQHHHHHNHQPSEGFADDTPRPLQSERPKIQGNVEEPLDTPATAQEDPTDTHWFIDDHDLLKSQGYDVDTMQQWWDGMMMMRK